MGRGGLSGSVRAISLVKAYFHSFWVKLRGFCNLLRQKQSSLFMLLGSGSISIASLMIQSIHHCHIHLYHPETSVVAEHSLTDYQWLHCGFFKMKEGFVKHSLWQLLVSLVNVLSVYKITVLIDARLHPGYN
jgi:hypothetical protein